MQVSVRELKAHLSRYLQQVRSGGTVEISSHRKVIARLTGVPLTTDRGISRLIASGTAEWAGGKPRGASIATADHERSVSDSVLDDRA